MKLSSIHLGECVNGDMAFDCETFTYRTSGARYRTVFRRAVFEPENTCFFDKPRFHHHKLMERTWFLTSKSREAEGWVVLMLENTEEIIKRKLWKENLQWEVTLEKPATPFTGMGPLRHIAASEGQACFWHIANRLTLLARRRCLRRRRHWHWWVTDVWNK